MDENTLKQFQKISRILRKRIYSIQMHQAVILDLDSTLLAAYGKQEGRAFNFHYQSNGYHLLVCYDGITRRTQNHKLDYAVVYGEFMYKASPWPYKRRVVCKVEKPENQMVYMYTFIVTNMDSSPEYLIKFYCKIGLMENFIKESKSGFDFSAVSSHNRIVNANRVQVHALAYNIFNWFRRLAL